MKANQQGYRPRNTHIIDYFSRLVLAILCCFIFQSVKSSEPVIAGNNQCLNSLGNPQAIVAETWRVDTIHIGTDYIVMKLPQDAVIMVNPPILKSHAPVLIVFKQDSIVDYYANTIFILNLLNGEPSIMSNSEILSDNGNKMFRREIENRQGDNNKYAYQMDYNGVPFQVLANNIERQKSMIVEMILKNIKVLRNQPFSTDNRYNKFIVRE